MFIDTANTFLNQVIKEITTFGIDVSNLKIDHIAYSANSTSEYEILLQHLLVDGKLVNEIIISNRRVAVIKLTTPIIYKDSVIEVVELIEHKADQKVVSGWEHVELLVKDYSELLKEYPNFNWDKKHMFREQFSRLKLVLPSGHEVKFLNMPILDSINEEKVK